MDCPCCTRAELEQKYAAGGVLIDVCPTCGGVWLDEGEIFFFVKDREPVAEALGRGLLDPRPSGRECPRCSVSMEEGGLIGRLPLIDQCPKCLGLWFDPGELNRIVGIEAGPKEERRRPDILEIEKDPDAGRRRRARLEGIAAGLRPLPNLLFRSVGTLVLLYALLGAVIIGVVEMGGMTPGTGFIIAGCVLAVQFVLGPWLMDLSLRWLYSFSWMERDQLPEHLREFLDRITRETRMRFPRVGLIHDGAPNAFTYGHTPGNARVVITQGILDLLDEKEIEAVVAHEIGHAKHWDMLLMTVANLVPLFLYFLFRSTFRVQGGSGRGGRYRLAIAITSYVLYMVAQYIVLWFSRTRELHADRFAGRVTGNPSGLASALVKIAYGLAAAAPAKEKADVQALGAFGIFDGGAARSLAVATQPGTEAAEGARREAIVGAMQWDLWNPWARYHELHSTHPLVARRLDHLGEQAASLGEDPYVIFDRARPESYWDEFLVDVGVHLLPLLAGIAVVGLALGTGASMLPPTQWIGVGLLALGVTSLVRVLFAYRGGIFPYLAISSLLRKVKVSSIRPVPARVRGTIIGKGVAGLIWSEDFILQDPTGIIFLDYRQPLRIWDWLFGLLKAGGYQGTEVEVEGWYRRAPVPYMEIKTLTAGGKRRRCYTYHVKIAVACILAAAGILILWI